MGIVLTLLEIHLSGSLGVTKQRLETLSFRERKHREELFRGIMVEVRHTLGEVVFLGSAAVFVVTESALTRLEPVQKLKRPCTLLVINAYV